MKPKWALVTGASSGLGVEFAKKLAQKNYDVIITARRADKLQQVAQLLKEKYKVNVLDYVCDLSNREDLEKFIKAVDSKVDFVHVLVNNAGFGKHELFVETEFPVLDSMMKLNMNHLTYLTHHYVKKMLKVGEGYVLQVASIGAYQPAPYYAVYAATKSYVLNFSAAVNFELRNTNVSVTTLCPGATITEFQEVAGHDIPPFIRKIAFMSAEKVAEIGIKAMFRRRSVVTAGIRNKVTYVLTRLIPRSWATWLAAKFSEE